MKKFLATSLKVGCVAGGGLFLIGGGHAFIGLYFNSLKNHGWKKIKKGMSKSKITSKQFWDRVKKISIDVNDDVEAGWKFIRG